MESDSSKVTIGDYVLKRELGSGANARVYLGYPKADESHRVAIKLINSEGSNSEDVNAQAIVSEAKILQTFKHPNIVQVYDLRADGVITNRGIPYGNNHLYCVMQLAQKGVMLDYLMTGGQMSEPIAKYYFKQLVDGLNYIHSKDCVHRDLKPDNLLIGDNYELLIADFGHAAQTDGTKNITQLSSRLGTPIYNAPEVSSKSKYDGRPVDSFMAGVVLFVFLTANTPFRDGANKIDPFYKHFMSEDPASFWKLHESRLKSVHFSSGAKNLMSKLFCHDPSKRPSLAEVMSDAWLSTNIASDQEVKSEMHKRLEQQEQKKLQEQQKAAAKKARARTGQKEKAGYGGEHRAVSVEQDGIIGRLNDSSDQSVVKQINNITFKEQPPVYTNEGSTFFNNYYSSLSPEELLKAVTVVANNLTDKADITISPDKFQVV